MTRPVKIAMRRILTSLGGHESATNPLRGMFAHGGSSSERKVGLSAHLGTGPSKDFG